MRTRPMQPERAQSTNLFASDPQARRFLRTPAKPFFFLFLGGLLALAGTSGCGRRPVPKAPLEKRFQGLSVTVACPGEPAATVVRRYGQIWASQTGAQLGVVLYDPAAGPDAG